jgi:hypothetical protein
MSGRGRPKEKNPYYAIYRGDEFLAHGYLWEMALKFNMAEKSIREMAHKSYYARLAKAPNPEKWLVAVKVEKLEPDECYLEWRRERAEKIHLEGQF